MNIALIDVKGRDDRAIGSNTAVNIRNMIAIRDFLGCDFFYNASQLINNKKNYDVLIFGFGSMSSNINEIKIFIEKISPKKIFWLVGDYEQTMNPSLYYAYKKLNLNYSIIQNFEQIKKTKFVDDVYILNINLLIAKKENKLEEKKYDCVYYSRWRPNRAKYLKKYLQKGIYVSTSSKNFKQYKHAGCDPKWIKKLSWENKKETLNLFKYSIYMEDEHTHSNYNFLANRFYESLFCNVVQFFDINCKNTIKKSGIEFNDYYFVESYKDLINKINNINQSGDWLSHLNFQLKWLKNALTEKEKMLQDFKKIILSS